MQALAEIAARQALRIEMRRLPFELLRRPPSAIHERSSPPLFAPFSSRKVSPRESCRPSCPPLGVSRPGPASLSLDLLDLDLLVLDLLVLDLLDPDLLDLDLLDLDLLDLDPLDLDLLDLDLLDLDLLDLDLLDFDPLDLDPLDLDLLDLDLLDLEEETENDAQVPKNDGDLHSECS